MASNAESNRLLLLGGLCGGRVLVEEPREGQVRPIKDFFFLHVRFRAEDDNDGGGGECECDEEGSVGVRKWSHSE